MENVVTDENWKTWFCQLAPGLVLHESDGRFTAAAEAVLRGGAALLL